MTLNGSRLALVTGAARGIGWATASGLAETGATVLVGARDLASAERCAEELQQRGLAAEPIKLDVTSAADRAAVKSLIERKFGRLDILVNNAGIMLEDGDAPFALPNNASMVPEHVMRATFETNFFALVALTQELLDLIKRSPIGHIVNVSSILGSMGIHATSDDPRLPKHRQLAYNASKAAVNMFTIHLAKELEGLGIKVSSSHPGWVRSDMGGPEAELSLAEGAATTLALTALAADAPTPQFRHLDQHLPW